PSDGNEIRVTPEKVNVLSRPRDRGFDIVHLTWPAVAGAGPVLHRQAHPAAPSEVGHQCMALQFSAAEHPRSAGYVDENGGRCRLGLGIPGSPDVEQLARVVA